MGWAVPLRAFQGCTRMCASTTTGLKPPWEESRGPRPVMMIQCNLLSLLYPFISFIFYCNFYFHFNLLIYFSFVFFFIFFFFLLKATLKALKKRLKPPMRLLH